MKNKQVFLNEIVAYFNLRQRKVDKPTMVYLVVRINGEQCKFSSGVKVYPKHWNFVRQEALVSPLFSDLVNRNNAIVNDVLFKLRLAFQDFKLYICSHLEEVLEAKDILKQKFIYKDRVMDKAKTAQKATDVLKNLVDEASCAESTKKVYRSNFDKFARYLDSKEISNSWDSMNRTVLTDYRDWLHDESGCSEKTVNGIMEGTILNFLKKADLEEDIPFDWTKSRLKYYKEFEVKYNKDKMSNARVALTLQEVEDLYSFDTDVIGGTDTQKRHYREAKELFLLQCFVGQRKSDLREVLNAEICEGKDVIVTNIKKTKEAMAYIPLFPRTVELINKYRDDDMALKFYLSKWGNDALREIFKSLGGRFLEKVKYQKGGVDKEGYLYNLIHTHAARYTFVTIAANAGVPYDDIIKVTGHSDEGMIKNIYRQCTQQDKIDSVQKAFHGVFDVSVGKKSFAKDGGSSLADALFDKIKNAALEKEEADARITELQNLNESLKIAEAVTAQYAEERKLISDEMFKAMEDGREGEYLRELEFEEKLFDVSFYGGETDVVSEPLKDDMPSFENVAGDDKSMEEGWRGQLTERSKKKIVKNMKTIECK